MASESKSSQRWGALRPPVSREFSRELIDSIIALRLTCSDWIVRRVDRITFLDTETTRKESEFHLIIPRGLPTVQIEKEKVHLLPLVTFERNVPLRSLKVTDESGALLSTLNKQEGRMVLEQVFDSLQRDSAVRLTADELYEIFSPKPDRGPSLSVPKVSKTEGAEDSYDISNWWSEELEEFLKSNIPPEEVALRTFVIDLWLGYIHLVVVPMTDHGEEGNRRRVITLSHAERVVSHDEPPQRTESPTISGLSELEGEFGGGLLYLRRLLGLKEHRKGRRLLEWFGSWIEPQWVRILWAKWYDDDSGSCHTEINVPPELEIRQAFLYKRHYGRAEEFGSSELHGEEQHFSGQWDLYTSAYTGSSAHLLEMGAMNGWKLVDPGSGSDSPEGSVVEERTDTHSSKSAESPAKQRTDTSGPMGQIRVLLAWLGGLSLRGQRTDGFLLIPKKLKPEERSLLSPPKPTERGLVAIVSIVLSARSAGLRRSGLFVGWFSLLMLGLAGALVWFSHRGVISGNESPNLEVLATVLVFAPTVAAAVISQRASHPMTQELTARLREAVVIFGVLPVLAVLVLAVTDGLGPYDLLGRPVSGAVLAVFCLFDLILICVLYLQQSVEKKIEPEPLPRSAYLNPDDPREGEGRPRGLTDDEKAWQVVLTSLRAQPSRTKVVQSVEGLRLPVARLFLVSETTDEKQEQPNGRHGYLTDGALRRAARRFADSAGIDLS